MYVLGFLLAAFVSLGVICWFFTDMINRSNNKGDSKADFVDFSSEPLVIIKSESKNICEVKVFIGKSDK